jgi:hypothetical protein
VKTKRDEEADKPPLPIIFSGPMVEAILEGRKTQTRRLVKPAQPSGAFPFLVFKSSDPTHEGKWVFHASMDPRARALCWLACPFGADGRRLYVREAHFLQATFGQHRDDDRRWGSWDGLPRTIHPDGTQICYYRQGFNRCAPRWRPSIHMPRWAARLHLAVVRVRVQRVQQISEADVKAEGFETLDAFRLTWIVINGIGSWDSNPWVWVVDFERCEPVVTASKTQPDPER